jgi:arylamine N-acetyltransferase
MHFNNFALNSPFMVVTNLTYDCHFGRAYAGAARVNQAYAPSALPEFSALSHMVIFVQPIQDSNKTYLVDVGFGIGLTKPILLSNADDNIITGTTPTEKHRLTRGSNLATSLGRCSTPVWC